MSQKKLPPEEGKDKGYIEIPLPNLSGIKDKVDGICDRIDERIAEHTAAEVKRDMQIMEQKGRVGLSPTYARAGYAFAVFSLLLIAVMIWLGLDVEGFILTTFVLLLSATLIFLGKYEIRYDEDGFSTRFGKKVLSQYVWSDVTDVIDDSLSRFGRKHVIVRGKKLFADASMNGFEPFYIRARRQVKGGGKTVPSEKKRKNRQKLPTPKRK